MNQPHGVTCQGCVAELQVQKASSRYVKMGDQITPVERNLDPQLLKQGMAISTSYVSGRISPLPVHFRPTELHQVA